MKPDEFGIFQLISLPGESHLEVAARLNPITLNEDLLSSTSKGSISKTAARSSDSPYPLSHSESGLSFSFWVADEGVFYAGALYAHAGVDLQTAVFARAENARQTWELGLEALQSGLFKTIFLKASEACRPALLRKMQLLAKDLKIRVFIRCKSPLPHWFFKASLHSTHETFPLLTKPAHTSEPSRSLLESYPQSKRVRA